MRYPIVLLLIIALLLNVGFAKRSAEDNMVLLPVKDDPTVSFRFLFKVGSQNDPEGKEGLAVLTASMISQGSSETHSYEEILELLYPMAASINDQVDKEMTVFTGRTHKDNLDQYYALFKEVLLTPALKEEDFKRVKSDLLNYLQKTLRYAQDEVLGKEVMYEFIFQGTPYEHIEEGHVASVKSITLDDVKQFYQTHYNQANLTIGLGGGYDEAFVAKAREDFETLPEGKSSAMAAPQPENIEGLQFRVVEKNANATAISFGFPIDVTRGSREFYALALATSWLGEHRNSSSHLYQVIREARGLNYGDYAYIEHFPRGHQRQFPPPNVARQKQIFQIWIRPVPNEARVFAFRAALRELKQLVDNGMSGEDFELTRKFLKNYILHYAPTTSMKLGYMLDDKFYGNDGYHWDVYEKMLNELTLEEVNAAIKKHWQYDNIKAAFITNEAEKLKEILLNNEPTPITYESEKPAEILEEDKEIAKFPLSVKPENVEIVPVEEVFEN